MKLKTGGAEGSDCVFMVAALSIGCDVDIHSFKGHTIYLPSQEYHPNIIIHSQEDLNKALASLKEANKTLKRKIPNEYIGNLLRRNYYQLEGTECVIAIGRLNPDGTVSGGTGWAVQMALNKGITVYLYNMFTNSWFRSISGLNLTSINKPPSLYGYKVVTGIGSRDISELAAREIINLFRNLLINGDDKNG